VVTQITQGDLKKIEAGIRDKYSKVANNPEGLFAYPTGRAGLETLEYDPKLVNALPQEVVSSYCGVGNPFSLGPINEGDVILDIGCGAGVDTIFAAIMAGPTGKAVGIDIVPEMVQQAKSNLGMTDVKNVTFIKTSGESLPFPDAEFDVVISNGVINLIPDRAVLLGEVMRVLRPGGRLMLADQAATGTVQKDIKARLANWFQ